jgi:uncharacterized cupredoxin-like copper-binding protein
VTQPSTRSRLRSAAVGGLVGAALLVACEPGTAPETPLPSAGSAASPREVNLIARDYLFVPDPVDVLPGETILLHIVNGGLEVHEAVIGDQAVQDAWEAAEAGTVGAPPGPTPVVSVPPEVAGLRVVVESGQRVDVVWTVPVDPADVRALLIGCHIPGHWAQGMRAGVRIAGEPSALGATLRGVGATSPG